MPDDELIGMANRDVFAYGWPLNSLWWDRYVQLSTEWEGIVAANNASIDVGLRRWHYLAPRNLPYYPLWPAFAVNTLLYTAPLLVIFYCVRLARRARPGIS